MRGCWLILVATLATAGPAGAQERYPNLRFSGFGTLGLATTDTHQVGYRRDNSQSDAAAIRNHLSGDLDSRFGLQASSKLRENLLVTLQVLSKVNYDNSYKPSISYASVAWNPFSNVLLRVGAMSQEVMPDGDVFQVGYAYLWARPPVEVFASYGTTRVRGFDLSQTFYFRPGSSLLVSVFGGKADEKVPAPGVGAWDWSGAGTLGASAWFRSGNWKIRGAYSSTRLPRNLPGQYPAFLDVLRAAGQLVDPQLVTLADRMDFAGVHAQTAQVAVAWASGPWQVQGAFLRRTTSTDLSPATNSGFVSAGYQIGAVTPYLLFARAVSKQPPQPDLSALAFLGPTGALLSRGVESLYRDNCINQHTLSAGLRWDLANGVDLKVQVDRVRAHNFSTIEVSNNPGGPSGWNGRLTVFSVVLDFIFGGGR